MTLSLPVMISPGGVEEAAPEGVEGGVGVVARQAESEGGELYDTC